jgi:hypothetical protein
LTSFGETEAVFLFRRSGIRPRCCEVAEMPLKDGPYITREQAIIMAMREMQCTREEAKELIKQFEREQPDACVFQEGHQLIAAGTVISLSCLLVWIIWPS